MPFEFLILDFIQNHIRSQSMDSIVPIITHLGDMGILWIVFSLIMLIIPRFRKVGIAMAAALVLDLFLCNILIKPFAARLRPCDINTAVQLLIPNPEDYSFPSGHTAAAFAVTSALFFEKNRLWIPALILSALIAFSRLYLYVHFPTDVLAGAVLGILCGWLGAKLADRLMSLKRKDEIS
ncbi:MAG: phosphatase PAP2 family protein [Porcipelethomonas sp.]